MPRVLPPSPMPAEVARLNDAHRQKFGTTFAPVEVLGHVPAFVRPYVGMWPLTGGAGHLPEQVRLLALLLVARRNDCAWCIDFVGAEAAHVVTAGRLAALGDHAASPLFDPAERAALAFADEARAGHVSDATFAELSRHYDTPAIVELAAAVAAETFHNVFNRSLGLSAQGFAGASADHADQADQADRAGASDAHAGAA